MQARAVETDTIRLRLWSLSCLMRRTPSCCRRTRRSEGKMRQRRPPTRPPPVHHPSTTRPSLVRDPPRRPRSRTRGSAAPSASATPSCSRRATTPSSASGTRRTAPFRTRSGTASPSGCRRGSRRRRPPRCGCYIPAGAFHEASRNLPIGALLGAGARVRRLLLAAVEPVGGGSALPERAVPAARRVRRGRSSPAP